MPKRKADLLLNKFKLFHHLLFLLISESQGAFSIDGEEKEGREKDQVPED
jgi:hypothetical protein